MPRGRDPVTGRFIHVPDRPIQYRDPVTGRFAKRPDDQEILPSPLNPIPVLDPDARIVDSLAQIGPPELGELRTIRVHIEDGMTAEDVIAEIETVVKKWNEKYESRQGTRLVDFWRQV